VNPNARLDPTTPADRSAEIFSARKGIFT